MIVLDTHVWIWWVHDDKQLPADYKALIKDSESDGLGVSAISCWEVAKLVEYGRLELPLAIDEWFDLAFSYPGIRLLALTPQVAIASTQLPPPFHKDPADQIIVATARMFDCPAFSLDRKIREYPHVRIAPATARITNDSSHGQNH